MASLQSGISGGNRSGDQKRPATFYLGLALYVISFFLPAVEWATRMPGWMCAYMALIAWPQEHLWLCLFGGIINPLVLVYIVLRFRDGAPRLRASLALTVLACIPLAWLSLSDLGAAIRIGHVFWIAGLLLILLPASVPWPTIQDARWLVIPPLLALTWWGLRAATEYPLQPPTDRDIFIYEVALQFKDPELCQKIPRYAEGNGTGGNPGREISYLQSDCYFSLASVVHDPSLCDRVRPISTGVRDGSKYTPKWCRVSPGYQVVTVVSPHTVDTWMRQLGYTDSELHHFQYRSVYNNPIHEAYDKLRKDSQFAERISAAPSFDELTAVGKSRPANDLEYLYGMFAIDANDSSVCGKISPNATSQSPGRQILRFRLDCYRSLAWNNRDPKMCEKLPAGNSLVPGANDYDFRKACYRNIEALRRDPTSKLTYGPGSPPTFESFQTALREIGYNVDLPRPTSSDYEDYLRHLEHDDPLARAEFLRRVAALK